MMTSGRWLLLFLSGLLFASCARTPGTIVRDPTGKPFLLKDRVPVTVRVDFGPAQRPVFEGSGLVTVGSTPRDALSVFLPLKSGMVCCDTREVSEIDGVPIDVSQGRWWVVRVNGNSDVSPYHTRLNAGDHVEWQYRESTTSNDKELIP